MFEVQVLNLENNIEFTKYFNDKKNLKKYVRKVNFSKKLKLLMIIDNSYIYD